MKTHQVLDLHVHPDDGQGCFDGTYQECTEFASTQSPHFMYQVVPYTKEELVSVRKMESLTSQELEIKE